MCSSQINDVNTSQFKLINKLTVKTYPEINFDEWVEDMNANKEFTIKKFKFGENKIKFEKIGQDVTLRVKLDMVRDLKLIITNLPTSIVNLIIDFQKTRYFQQSIHNCDEYFTNLPANLSMIVFIFPYWFTMYIDNKFGYFNFLFNIKKSPFGFRIKLCIDNLLYDVNYKDSFFPEQTLSLTSGGEKCEIKYNSSKSTELICYV
jgi:hypothetical protein